MRRVTCQFQTRAPAPFSMTMEPGVSYVTPDLVAFEWFKAAPDGVRISTLRSWERPYFGQDLNGRRLWVSRGAGFGDQLVMSGVLRELKRRWPEASIDFATHPDARDLFGVADLDSTIPDVFRFSPQILRFSEWQAYHYHRIVEEIIELDMEPDQSGIWETHFRFFGIDPATVPPERMRPMNIATMSARGMADQFKRDHNIDRFIFVQLASTSPIRSLSPARVTALLAELVRAFPSHAIVAVGGPAQRGIEIPAGVVPCVGNHPRVMVGLVAAASAIVCPDSCVNHIAAGLGDASPPVVSLWSSFDPDRRVASYPNNHALYNRLPCSPCFMHEHQNPPLGCPMYRGHCRGLDSIPFETIIEKLREVMP